MDATSAAVHNKTQDEPFIVDEERFCQCSYRENARNLISVMYMVFEH